MYYEEDHPVGGGGGVASTQNMVLRNVKSNKKNPSYK